MLSSAADGPGLRAPGPVLRRRLDGQPVLPHLPLPPPHPRRLAPRGPRVLRAAGTRDGALVDGMMGNGSVGRAAVLALQLLSPVVLAQSGQDEQPVTRGQPRFTPPSLVERIAADYPKLAAET